ncbi:MAG: 30S ribosomal protein S12 methylthiotransferase RimO [Acidobacteria bacterium]|nr:30S ribosomal protein S12 methylthiotransferase RimO [Acidobacteriota bacterium]
MSKTLKLGFLSLGCAKNLVDGEVMLGLARQRGHATTPEAADADVLIVNTCAFIDSAKQESIDAILEMAAHKKAGTCTRLVVTGCLAERYRDELQRQIPEIDAVLGTGEVPEIVAAIEGQASRTPGTTPGVDQVTFFRTPSPGSRAACPGRRPNLPSYLYDAETPRVLTTPRHFAYLKVAEGCDYTCAFCIIPTLRGRYRSRPADSIVREARALAARGVREIILISQDTTFYGVDQRERGALARLLRQLNAIDGLAWIRLLYLYPTTIGDDVLDAMAECEKVCRYVDLPLQHASSDVLRRMGRPGSRRTYEALLARIRARVPGVTLRTTLIVGFPGETDRDFAELCGFVRAIEFSHVGVFTYSHEEGTRAYAWTDDVEGRVKRERRNTIMKLQKRIAAAAQRRRRGELVRVMVDGAAAEHPLVLQGRLEGQAPEVDAVVYLTDCDPSEYGPGELIHARITGARGYDLLARPLPSVSAGDIFS